MGAFDIIVPPAPAPAAQPGGLGLIPTGIGIVPDPSTSDWRCALLTAMGAPCSAANLKVLAYWHQSEGTALSTNNWLAITDPGNKWPHAGVVASNGGNPVYAFPDMATGVAATAAFLRGSYYTAVVSAFKADAGMGAIFNAINRSPWCGGCQGGHYPVALYQALGNPSAPDPGPGGGGSTAGGGGLGPIQPSKPEEPGASDCFLGPFVMPGSVPNIPCLLSRSNLWAMAGAVSLVAGAGIMLLGAVLVLGKSVPLPRVAGMGSRSGSLTRGQAFAEPMQTEDQVEETNFLLAQQRESEERDRNESRRAARQARQGRVVDNPSAARARRTPRTSTRREDLVEEPF